MPHYLDISSFQSATFPFRSAKAQGFDGVWIKATEGKTWVNPLLPQQVRGAREAGLRVGFYHFARPDHNTAVEEAINFIREVKRFGIQRRDLRPALDLEVGTPQNSYVQWSRVWNHTVKEAIGVGPLFYSYPSYIKGLHAVQPIGYGLWIASYANNDGSRHPVIIPNPWKKYAAHQYTSRGHIRGNIGNLDMSYVPPLSKLRVLAHPVKGLI
jgi:lysozyme